MKQRSVRMKGTPDLPNNYQNIPFFSVGRMKLVSDALRLGCFLLSAPFKAVHWASFKVATDVLDWHPLDLLAKGSKYALLILNQPIEFTKDTAVMIWNRGTYYETSYLTCSQ